MLPGSSPARSCSGTPAAPATSCAPRATVYIDPFTGPSDDKWVRGVAPPFDASQVRRCDLILSTHEHRDHCDPDALVPMLAGTGARLAGPASSIEAARGF